MPSLPRGTDSLYFDDAKVFVVSSRSPEVYDLLTLLQRI